MLTLFNPTNETLVMMYAGVDVVMRPDSKLQVDDAKGNHLLNGFAQRGLCQLVFGDDEKKIAAEGIARNLEFKKVQVTRYNFMNEQRKNQGMSYLPATRQVQQYAQELQMTLAEPYALKDLQATNVQNILRKNQELEERFVTLQQQNQELLAMLQKLLPQEGKPPEGKAPEGKKGKG